MVDLDVCIEAIRRAIVYGWDIANFRRKYPKDQDLFVRTTVECFTESLRAIAENCPIPDYKKESLLDKYRKLKDTTWQTAFRYMLNEDIIRVTIDDTLAYLRDYLGYKPTKYDKYIPK